MRPAALFDFDGTLCRGDSAAPFVWFVLRRHPRSLAGLPLLAAMLPFYGLGRVSKKTIKTAMLGLLGRVPAAKRNELAERFFVEVIEPRLFRQGLERLAWHRTRGDFLVLATASVDFYMQEVQRRLGFDALVATRSELEPAPRVVGENCWGEEKVRRLRGEGFFGEVDWEASWAYSDHASDEPILRLCGNRMAINPHRPLRRLARREGWAVARWR